MDSKSTKAQGRRQPQEEEPLSSRRPNRLFLSETIPPSTHHQTQANQSRSHNLSDRIHEYYEKLVNTSLVKKIDNTPASHQFPSSNFHNRFDAAPKFREPLHSLSSVRTVLQPANTNARQSYTVFVEDPSGAFQQYVKNPQKPSSELNEPPCHDNISHKVNVSSVTTSMRGLMDKKKSSPTSSRGQCNLCHSPNHSSQNCTLQSRMPAEHDGYPSDPIGDSPSTRHSKLGNENQGDGSEERITSVLSFPKKRTIPANINVSCERDVIGQEKSPVSKSHPTSSTALSTSSSNGDTVPRERKKWVRPPLVGQAASSSEKSPFMSPGVFDCLDDHSPALDRRKQTSNDLQLSSSTGSDQADSQDRAKGFSHQKSSYFDSSNKTKSGLLQSDDFYSCVDRDTSSTTVAQLTSEGEQGLSDSCAGGRVSPSSSVTSNRRLEWDSGADVGYNQMYGSATPDASSSGLCTIERMALAQGCSVALHLRLDPEGTTVPTASSGLAPAILPSPVQDKQVQSLMGKPTAESTPVDQLPHVVKALRKYRHDTKTVISPIVQGNVKYDVEVRNSNTSWAGEREDEMDQPKSDEQKSKYLDTAGPPPTPFLRQISNSMQDLRNCVIKESEMQKSHSDPDVSGEMPICTAREDQSKFLKEISKGQNIADTLVATHSISSGSDATLVRVGTEEDLANDVKENVFESNLSKTNTTGSEIRSSSTSPETSLSNQPSHSKEESIQSDNTAKEQGMSLKTNSFQIPTDYIVSSVPQPKQNKSSGNMHVCSDSDHVRGLHHHFGVLCSTVLGGHIQSSVQPNIGSELENIIHGPDRVYVPSEKQSNQCKPATFQSPPLRSSEYLAGESTGSSAFHSDVAHEENVPCASTLTGRANSFEYLPGHMYEKKSSSGFRKHERPPGISTSTETDSEPVRPISRVTHRKVMDSSSHDTEDERLWGSPRMGSNSLVQDLERGVNLLKGVMENKSAGRRCKRELVRRIIKKLVTSEYVEDMIEKERIRHQTRSPFSPRKAKYQERQDRNIRSKRYAGPERRDISGESDEPKRTQNVRRKLPTYQTPYHSQGPKTLSTLASGSKSSSLWSSNAESTSGSISLSGSSENQKESKTSVKTNPLYEQRGEKTADWLKPATQSEKLFEMRKNGTSHAEKHLATLIGMPPQDPVLNPIKIDTQKQLSWVTNEINNLKILKELLQKQESLKQSLDPNLCETNLIAMPVTGMKQTMQMADCTSPDIPESHSPKLKPSRMRQWISLESDTSAGFGLSNNTASSRDSHWQDVEVACPGEQDSLPHRTVSISDADEGTEASCSLSNRKSDGSHKSGPLGTHKPRRRSVSISDTDQHFGPPSGSDIAVQKKRSDCHCGKPDVRGVRPPRISTYGPPPRNLSSDKLSKQVCESCTTHSHVVKKDTAFSADNTQGALSNRGVSSAGAARTIIGLQSEHHSQAVKCICGAAKVQTKNCCCTSSDGIPLQVTGAVKKGTAGTSHQMVPKVVAEVTSHSSQPLPGKGLVRVHIETQQEQDSAQGKSESQCSSVFKERVHIAEVSDDQFSSGHVASDDSITKAVRQAVSSKVKALKSIGQIEEAEVKIRVKVAPDQVSEGTISHSGRGRVLKSQDLEDENVFHPSKHSEVDDLISKQMAMDLETRQKLLAIAESRQRAQMGLHDVDRRIQDLLLQDYISRQFKPPESPSIPHARLNVRVEAPVLQGNSVGVQSDVDKKTTGTITSAYLQQSPPLGNDQSYTLPSPQIPQPPPQGACICGTKSLSSARQPQSVVNHGQQTDDVARPQTAPGSCLCSGQSQLASSARTYHACSPVSSPERQVEFELDLWKKQPPKPYKMTPHEVHETLKSRNTAYFLQFEEDPSLEVEPHTEVTSKPQMEVVTMKIPKPKRGAQLPSYRPSSAQGGKKSGKGKSPQKRSAFQTSQFGGKDQQAGSSQSGYGNLLRSTPGRSHLSITITDSSADSTLSPDGDSMYSSLQHPPRKPHRSPHSNKRQEKIYVSGNIVEGEGSPTNASPNEGSKSPCTGESSSKLNLPKENSKLPASDSESIYNYLGDHSKSVPSLQEYLERNHPKYLDAAEKRRRCIAEMSYLRHLRQQSRRRLLELEGDSMWTKQKQQWRARCISRPRPAIKKRPIMRVSKSACARKYMFLPESQQRLAEIKKKEEKRTNRLMAELYTRKLQEKVLKGTATIRSSVSVLSGL